MVTIGDQSRLELYVRVVKRKIELIRSGKEQRDPDVAGGMRDAAENVLARWAD
jgi:hypothetical protein